jgi:hypothetical protein
MTLEVIDVVMSVRPTRLVVPSRDGHPKIRPRVLPGVYITRMRRLLQLQIIIGMSQIVVVFYAYQCTAARAVCGD